MSKRNIVHVEIPVANQDNARKFYSDLFGWKMTPMPEMNYTMWETGDGEHSLGGGFPIVSDENPAGKVLIYVASEDIEADLKKAEKLGGKMIHPKTEIPGMGWYAIFQDPNGNNLGLFSS